MLNWTSHAAGSYVSTVFPTVPDRVGKDGRAWLLSCVKTAVLWVGRRALSANGSFR